MRFRRILRWSERSESWKTLFSLVIVVLVTLSVYTTFSLAMRTSTPLVVVISDSMEPTLHRGDLLAIQSISEDQIEVDDVIVFWADWHPDIPIVHRVVKIYEDESGTLLFTTQGDNNSDVDYGNRTIDDVIGVVVGVLPFIGYVSLFLQTMEGKLIVIAIIVIVLSLPEVIPRIRESDE